MAKTYSGDPANSSRDAVRFLCRDTTDGSMVLEDAEIDWLLTDNASNKYLAAADACELISERYAQSKTVGDLSITYNITSYVELAKSLREKAVTKKAVPVAGGVSSTDTTMYFQLGLHDNPDTGS